jgi:hypothetical protein
MPVFNFILVSYGGGVGTSSLDIRYFAWGLPFGSILKLTGSLLAVELSCCDYIEVKVGRGIVPFPNGTRTHVSLISGSNGPVSEPPPA